MADREPDARPPARAERRRARLGQRHLRFAHPRLRQRHAHERRHPHRRTVWTFYWSLAEYAPADGRRLLLEKDWNYWKEAILNDLSRAHPDIRQCVSHIDVMRLGHAMVRPAPGFMFSRSPPALDETASSIHFANSDLSGISIFEEAQYRGVQAAMSS